jgi:hypothetical protein
MNVKTIINGLVEVNSFLEASRKITEERDILDIGANAWYANKVGGIYQDRKKVAYVSYNGRVWEEVNGKEIIL